MPTWCRWATESFMKIDTVKAILHLRTLLQLSPYLLHFSSDFGKIHYWRWCLLCGQNYPCRKLYVGRCIVVTQTLFVWPTTKGLTRRPCHRDRCSKKKRRVFLNQNFEWSSEKKSLFQIWVYGSWIGIVLFSFRYSALLAYREIPWVLSPKISDKFCT